MKKTALLLLLALTAFASTARAGWFADRLKPGPIRVGPDAASIFTRIDLHTVTFLNASGTTQSTTVAGIATGDTLIAQPIGYTGTAAVVSTTAGTNSAYMKWSADPGTTVTVRILQLRKQ